MTSQTEQSLSKAHVYPETHSEVLALYNDYPTYDKECKEITYNSPALVAAALIRHLSDNRDVKILDVAAGTGLVGEKLKEMGLNIIDALDASEGMLQVPKQKNIYQNYIIDFFPCEKKWMKTSSYDALVCCHGLGEGMNCDALPEMVRCVRTGGLVTFIIREDYLNCYKLEELEPLVAYLEEERQWCPLERTVIPNIYRTHTGVIYVFKVTKPDLNE